MKMMRKLGTALSAVSIVAASCITTAPAVADDENQQAPCQDVEVVFARGSGQPLLADVESEAAGEQKTDKAKHVKEAKRVKELAASNAQTLGLTQNFYELGTRHINGASYPAHPIQGFTSLLNAGDKAEGSRYFSYEQSVNEGVREGVGYLQQRMSQCPNSQYVLGGYSQGAQVMGDVYGQLTDEQRSKVAFNAFFGDPKLNLPEGRSVAGEHPVFDGQGISPWRRQSPAPATTQGSLGARTPYLPAGEQNTGSWCLANDYVCGSTKVLMGFSRENGHMLYAQANGPIDEALREAFSRVGQRRGVEDAAARLTPAGSGPVVNLPADEYYAPVGHTVRLDAGASYSAGSKIVRWDWDIDGDGVYETHDGAAVMEHSYSAQGDYTVKVRATDSNGAVTERQVTVHAGTTTGIPTLPEAAATVSGERNGTEATLRWSAAKAPELGWQITVNGFPVGVYTSNTAEAVVTGLDASRDVQIGVAPVSAQGIAGEVKTFTFKAQGGSTPGGSAPGGSSVPGGSVPAEAAA